MPISTFRCSIRSQCTYVTDVHLTLGFFELASDVGRLGLSLALGRRELLDVTQRLLQLGVQLRQLSFQLFRVLVRAALYSDIALS